MIQAPYPHNQHQSRHLPFPIHTQLSCKKPFEARIPLFTTTTKDENSAKLSFYRQDPGVQREKE